MKTILMLALLAGCLACAQTVPTPLPGDPIRVSPPVCTGSVTTNCVPKADSSGNVTVGTTVLDPVNGITTSKVTAGTSLMVTGAEATPGFPLTANTLWFDPTTHNLFYGILGSSAVDRVPIQPQASRTANQFVTNCPSSGICATAGIVTADVPVALDTRTSTFTDISPGAGDDGLIVILNPAAAVHLTRFSCGVTGTTSIVTNLVKGGASLIADMTATAGDINTVVVTTWANGSSQCGGTSSCAVAAHAPVTVHIGTITGSPTSLSCALDYTVD